MREETAAAGSSIARAVGLHLEPAQRTRLEKWLVTTAGARNVAASVIVDEILAGGAALQEALDAVTIQETSFFRDSKQFEALAQHVLPHLRSPIKIWSAGCSNGQEPYSLAMQLDSLNVGTWNIVATDISTSALTRTRQAKYLERELRGLPEPMKTKYLKRVGTEWEVANHLREHVDVRRHGLTADPLSETFSVVFCRNVLIYLDRPSLIKALKNISEVLRADGTLFLGYSESLWRISEQFEMVQLGNAFAYRHPGAMISAEAEPKAPVKRGVARGLNAPRRSVRKSLSLPQNIAPARTAITQHDVAALLDEGEMALQNQDFDEAVSCFRKAVYVAPDDPIAHFNLGLALEQSGHARESVRAFKAARVALRQSDSKRAEAALEGFDVNELNLLLDARIGGRGG